MDNYKVNIEINNTSSFDKLVFNQINRQFVFSGDARLWTTIGVERVNKCEWDVDYANFLPDDSVDINKTDYGSRLICDKKSPISAVVSFSGVSSLDEFINDCDENIMCHTQAKFLKLSDKSIKDISNVQLPRC